MKLQDQHHDDAVLVELGHRLAQLRIDMNLTQAELSKKAGVGKRTLERLEAGQTVQTLTLVRIFRELGLLTKLEVLFPESTSRKRNAVKAKEKLPQRVSRKKSNAGFEDEWKWGDEMA